MEGLNDNVTEPVGSELKNIVLCLGGFHTEISFLGCIVRIMAASGLQELLELIYAPWHIHMLSGKAIARAVRGHFIVDAALNALILANAINAQCSESALTSEELSEITCVDEYLTQNIDLTEAAVLYEKLMQGFVSADHIFQQDILANINDIMKGMTVSDYTFKRCHQVVTLDTKSAIEVEGITIQIEPFLLFQRLTPAVRTTNNIKDIFKYELCSYPPALFDSSLLLRQPQKPAIANAICHL